MNGAPSNAPTVAVVGASGNIGRHLLARLTAQGWYVIAFSAGADTAAPIEGVTWHRRGGPQSEVPPAAHWIFVAPVWLIPEWFDRMSRAGAKRVVAISSTSIGTKTDSSTPAERETAALLARGEQALQGWAAEHDIRWTILRPTLIWGGGTDRNVSEIARVAARLGFFPLPGGGRGLRQPIHADDVAAACVAALHSDAACSHAYDIPGGETLSYAEMARRICRVASGRARLIPLPLWLVRAGVRVARHMRGNAHWTPGMVERINRDITFDITDAARDLHHSPRGFHPTAEDVPASLLRGESRPRALDPRKDTA